MKVEHEEKRHPHHLRSTGNLVVVVEASGFCVLGECMVDFVAG